MKGKVVCDSCGWNKQELDVATWHLKQCPECGVAPIVSDEDLAVVQFMDGLIESGLATQEKTDKPSIEFRLNTASLRNK